MLGLKCHNNKNNREAPDIWRFAALAEAMSRSMDIAVSTPATPTLTCIPTFELDTIAYDQYVADSMHPPSVDGSSLSMGELSITEIDFDKSHCLVFESDEPIVAEKRPSTLSPAAVPEGAKSKRQRTGITSFKRI